MPEMKFQIDYSKEKFKNRDVIVDNVKGLLTILFMLVHVTRNLPRTFTLSEWFYHSDPVLIGFWGFNILDLAPVAFYFVIGFVLWDATTRHYSQAGKKAYKNYILRNFTLIGIFLLLVYLQNSVQSVLQSNFKPDAWNYMAGIGFTGILVAPFLTSVFRTKGVLSLILKIVAAVVTLAVYGLLHDVLFKFFGTSSGSGGGIAASFGFVSTVILAGVMKDLEKKGILAYSIGVGVFEILGIVAGTVFDFPIAYQTFTPAYLFIAFTKVNVIFYVLYVINRYLLKRRAVPVLATVGRNILLYIFMTLALITVLALKLLPIPELNVGGVIIADLAALALFLVVSVPLKKKNILFKL